jgi:hypothetical protein
MTSRRSLILGLSAMLVAALYAPGPAASGSQRSDYRRSADLYRSETRLRGQRDHHRGRSFGERRSRLRNPSYLRRDERRRALGEAATRQPSQLSDAPVGGQGSLSCRTMTAVEEIEGRRALISQRECIDDLGLTRISPASRRVIRYYDE